MHFNTVVADVVAVAALVVAVLVAVRAVRFIYEVVEGRQVARGDYDAWVEDMESRD